MPKSFTDFSELDEYIREQCATSAAKVVKEYLRDVVLKHSKKAVEPRANFSKKMRTRSQLANEESIFADIDRFETHIEIYAQNIAFPSGPIWGRRYNPFKKDKYETTFAEWVNDGLWMDLKAYIKSGYKEKVKRPARPFMDEARAEVAADIASTDSALMKDVYRSIVG